MNGEPFTFDEFEAHRMGIISGTGKVVIGKVGFRKSTGVKTDISRKRFMKRGDRIRKSLVLDYKGEYDLLTESFGVKPTSFVSENPADRLKLNVLDNDMLDRNQQQILLEVMFFSASKRVLDPVEQNALSAAIQLAHKGDSLAMLPSLIEALYQPDATIAADYHSTPSQLIVDAKYLGATFQQIQKTVLPGVFDGPTSKEIKLTEAFTAYNFHGLSELAKPILISCLTSFLEAAWLRKDPAYHVDDVVYEEVWEYFRYLNFVRNARKEQKLHRNTGVNYTYILHRLSDMSSAADDGTEAVKLAKGLLADTAIKVIYKVDESEIEETQKLCDLNDIETYQVKHFKPGEALWKFGEFSIVVKHVLAEGFETRMVYTDGSMHRDERTGRFETPPS